MKHENLKTRRLTIQKVKILEYLKSVKTHPSAEEVYNNVKKDIPTITLATVYRNLNQMSDDGIIKRLEINHEYRYDAQEGNHLHFLCTKSGKIYDIEDEESHKFLLSRLDKNKFDTQSVNVIYTGVSKTKN
jgi:Fur family transcriptional regulator, peroxide stress response regulator